MHSLPFPSRTAVPLAVVASLMLGLIVSSGLPAADDEPSFDENSTASVAKSGVLVMRTGRVASGRILKSGDNYTVEHTHGRMFVPGSEVRFHCASLSDAYRKLHDAAKHEASAKAHTILARWCITNKLLSESRLELNDALVLEPDDDEARDLLRRVDDLLDPKRPPEPQNSTDVKPSTPVTPRFRADEIESLAGVSRDQAQQFTRRIQPILVNNCAVSGCHGAKSDTGFRLQRVVPGGDTSRIASERNLAEILQQVDFQSPRTSPILTVPRGNHGRHGKPGFPGPRGADQYDDLRKWVLGIAKSDVARHRQDGAKPRKSGKIAHASASVDSAPAEASDSSNSARSKRKAAVKSPSPKDALRIMADPFAVAAEAARDADSRGAAFARDPFDVTEFNRKSSAPKPRR
ncbi:MAG: hypothetical protein EXS05_09575 [Planctomycetaceae bacterium]|nr:hypothetical protein [Planctomycetaceae bacterium]